MVREPVLAMSMEKLSDKIEALLLVCNGVTATRLPTIIADVRELEAALAESDSIASERERYWINKGKREAYEHCLRIALAVEQREALEPGTDAAIIIGRIQAALESES